MVDSHRIGYALCLAGDPADAREERSRLAELGCTRVYVDQGVRLRRNAEQPGLVDAMRACQAGYTLVVTSLDRLGPHLREVTAVVAALADRHVRLEIAGELYDWTDPVARALPRTLAMLLDYQAALTSRQTREGIADARQTAPAQPQRPLGRPPTLSPTRQQQLRQLRAAGSRPADLADLFGVSVATVKRIAPAPVATAPIAPTKE